jgi:hypothetical protein
MKRGLFLEPHRIIDVAISAKKNYLKWKKDPYIILEVPTLENFFHQLPWLFERPRIG